MVTLQEWFFKALATSSDPKIQKYKNIPPPPFSSSFSSLPTFLPDPPPSSVTLPNTTMHVILQPHDLNCKKLINNLSIEDDINKSRFYIINIF